MASMPFALHRRYALFLTVLVCGIGFSGCIKKTADPPTTAEATLAAEIQQSISVGSITCDPFSSELTITDADPAELEQLLPRLPQLAKLTLEGKVPDPKTLLAIKDAFPNLTLVCGIDIGSKSFSTDEQALDLSGLSVDPDMLRATLPLFFDLQELILTDSELSDSDKMTLIDCLPEVLVRCELPIAGQYYPTDSTEIDLSGRPVTTEDVERMLPYFPRLKKLDMSFCGISDEEMESLNQRHPNVSIVWTVTIGMVKTRTDATYFYPAEANYYPTNEEMKKLRYCTELVAIDIGHTRATDCEFLWYTPKVRYLILADTGITDITPVGNLKELIYLELFNLKTKDYSPLLNCTKLQDLNIGTTHADPEPLSKMTWLHNLQWHRADQDPATKEAVLKLPEQLPDTNVVLYPKNKARNIGGPWRYIPNYYVFRDMIGATYFNQDQIWDYWGKEDGDRIMACESGKSFAAYTLAEIVRERIDSGEPIIGIKNSSSEKAEILYETLLNAESWITEEP